MVEFPFQPRGQMKKKQKSLGCFSFCRNFSAERPARHLDIPSFRSFVKNRFRFLSISAVDQSVPIPRRRRVTKGGKGNRNWECGDEFRGRGRRCRRRRRYPWQHPIRPSHSPSVLHALASAHPPILSSYLYFLGKTFSLMRTCCTLHFEPKVGPSTYVCILRHNFSKSERPVRLAINWNFVEQPNSHVGWKWYLKTNRAGHGWSLHLRTNDKVG